MKKEQQGDEQASLAAKIQKENVIVFKKKNSGKLARSSKDPSSDQEIELNRLNGSLKPKPQVPSQQSAKADKRGLPVLSLANNSAGKKLIIQKALLEYAKNLPAANPYQDKEALQHEAWQLKKKNNELAAENMRLRTRIMTVEKQNLRLQRTVEQDKPYPIKQISTAASGGRQSNPPKSTDQTISSLKVLLRDNRKQLQEMREQNTKIKRSVKYTRLNELEQEKKCYAEETLRLRQLLEEQFSQNIQHKIKEHDMSSLEQKYLQQQDLCQALKRDNAELVARNKKIEEKMKTFAKVGDVQRNLNKIIMGLKKNLKDKDAEVEALRKDLKETKEAHKEASQHDDRPKVPSAQKHRAEMKELKPPVLPPTLAQHGTPQNCPNCSKNKAQLTKLSQQIKKLQLQLSQKNSVIQQLKTKPGSAPSVKSTVRKPSPQILKTVSDFLGYRFKAHHLPIAATQTYLFRKDQNSSSTATSVGNMIEILLTEPFFITNSEYLESLVVHLFYNDRAEEEFDIDENLEKPNAELFATFKALIGEYAIMDAKKEEEMFIQIAQLVTNYCQHISAAFDSKRNGQGTISRQQMYIFLNQIELQKQYIEFIITQIILESADLEHLNYFALFEIFYLPVQEEVGDPGTKKMLGIEGEVKELDEEYEDSQSHNNDVEEKKQPQTKKGSGFRSRNKSQDKELAKKEQSQEKVEEDYYEDFDDQDQEPPVEKKARSGSKTAGDPNTSHNDQPSADIDEQYADDYQM